MLRKQYYCTNEYIVTTVLNRTCSFSAIGVMRVRAASKGLVQRGKVLLWGGRVDEVARAKNRTKSRVRSKVEHVFGVMKLKFGFAKVRYRGLLKNANRLFATCALVNLFMVRKKLRNAMVT